MSLSLAIAVNVVADLALIALLAFVMTRAARLKPHAGEQPGTRPSTTVATPAQRRKRAGARLGGAPLTSRS